VLTETGSVYEEDYREVFEQVDRYVREHYVDAGDLEYGGARPLRLFVRADLAPVRRYEPLNAPCVVP
jgi:hypothetical protein